MKLWVESTCLVLVLLVAACSGDPETGPGEVRWDKVACTRCIMAVSDHHYSAQVRGGPSSGKTKLYYFDDLGCAVLWLAEQKWRGDERTEMWVTDARSGRWLDAFKAYYSKGQVTPMDYGLGAQADSVPGALSFDQASQEIRTREAARH